MNDINSSVKAMWFKLKLDKIHLRKVAIANNFEIHHAEKTYIML